MVLIVKEINGQKKLIPLTSDVGSGVPLGTLVAFSDDTPKDGYLQTGTTYDETKYPALYAMLGSNQIPAYYDHSRPSEYELLSTLEFTAQYDGEVIVWSTLNSAQQYFYHIYINDVDINTASCQWAWSIFGSVPFKYGDSIRITGTSITAYARYYKHPLFIKATSGLAENQQENVLNTLNNNLSYSTEEHATGRKWIDGKMIYELTVTGLSYGGTTKAWTNTGYTFSNCDTFIKGYARRTSDQAVLSEMSFRVNNSNLQYYTGLGWSGSDQVTVEYTKTT